MPESIYYIIVKAWELFKKKKSIFFNMYMNLIHWLFVLPLCVILCCKSFYYWFQIFLPHILFWPIQQPNVYVFELKTGIKVLGFFFNLNCFNKKHLSKKAKRLLPSCSKAECSHIQRATAICLLVPGPFLSWESCILDRIWFKGYFCYKDCGCEIIA